jgi:hypothetical protein
MNSRTAEKVILTEPSNAKRTACGGMLSRKERWGLTWRGRLMVLLVLVGLGCLVVWRVHPFLAVTAPVEAKLLIVEGWIPDYALAEALAIFRARAGEKMITVGGPVRGVPVPAAEDDTYAYVAAKRLIKLGATAELVEIVSNRAHDRERTYSCAVTLRDHLAKRGKLPEAINVITVGPHARRTRLLYEHAFGAGTKVGIISVDRQEYDQNCWWRYSEGVKEVTGETIAYLYSRFAY